MQLFLLPTEASSSLLMQRVKLDACHRLVVSCHASLPLTNLSRKKVESKVKTFLSRGEMIYCLKLQVFSGLCLPSFHIATILFIFWTTPCVQAKALIQDEKQFSVFTAETWSPQLFNPLPIASLPQQLFKMLTALFVKVTDPSRE